MAARDETRDPVTFRANRVVAWLEGNARAAMTREAEGVGVADVFALRRTTEAADTPNSDENRVFVDGFARNECAWDETARALDASATSDGRGQSLSLELDPDGPARANGALHPTNADAEARLCRAAFRLVRGGMMDAARELCIRAGQPWRAASLGGAAPGPGGFAPAPVGAAADAAFSSLLPLLNVVRESLPYFRLSSANVLASCKLLPQELFECYTDKSCEVHPVDDEEVPDWMRKDDLSAAR